MGTGANLTPRRLKTARVALVFVGHYGSSILSLQFGETLPAAHACTYTLLEYNRTQRCTLYTWTCFEYLLIVYLAGGWEGVKEPGVSSAARGKQFGTRSG